MTPCYNEELNIRLCYEAIKTTFENDLPSYDREHLFIDNCSGDKTVDILKEIAARDRCVKVIVNARNFGPHQSPYYAILQTTGDAVVPVTADLQTPPEIIKAFVAEWEKGFKIVLGKRISMQEGWVIEYARNLYYQILEKFSNTPQVQHFMGFGLFDRKIIEILRAMDDPLPYFRGLIFEIGFRHAVVEFKQALGCVASQNNPCGI